MELELAQEGHDEHGGEAAEDHIDHVAHAESVHVYPLHSLLSSFFMMKVK